MAAHARTAHLLARQLFKVTLADGGISAERVAGILDYIEKHQPANPIIVLREYHRLMTAELARGEARIEHAGPLSDAAVQGIAAALAKKYHRPISAVHRANPALIAGLRVRVGDDVYESSVAGQLQELANFV